MTGVEGSVCRAHSPGLRLYCLFIVPCLILLLEIRAGCDLSIQQGAPELSAQPSETLPSNPHMPQKAFF